MPSMTRPAPVILTHFISSPPPQSRQGTTLSGEGPLRTTPPGRDPIQRISSAQEIQQVPSHLLACPHDGASPAHVVRRPVRSPGSRAIKQVRVPHNLILIEVVVVMAEPAAEDLLPVPELDDPRVGKEAGRPLGAIVTLQHVEPHSIHPEYR